MKIILNIIPSVGWFLHRPLMSVFRFMLVSMIARSDEGTGFDITETHFESVAFEFGKFIGSVELLYRQSPFGRLEILANGQNVAID